MKIISLGETWSKNFLKRNLEYNAKTCRIRELDTLKIYKIYTYCRKYYKVYLIILMLTKTIERLIINLYCVGTIVCMGYFVTVFEIRFMVFKKTREVQSILFRNVKR